MELTRDRAAELLAAGPADSVAVVAYACGLSGAPVPVADHMAAVLLDHPRFCRHLDGRWGLTPTYDVARSTTYAVVDVETTGGPFLAGHRITEVAVAVVRDGAIHEVFETLVNPERSIPPFVSALTHITWAMVRDKPRFADIRDDLLAALHRKVFVAHNVAFDWKFVSGEIARAGGPPLAGRRLCTVKLARRVLPQLRRRSLDHLARHYGVRITARHRAGGDAVATAECLIRMLGDAADRGIAV
ncbi:MAG TPA: 3'-5' exonuclease [Gemmatimonadaceae bacterium]|nr:3'-5' exonuclease [Gemmatimonadaceae bacterium]